MQADMRMLAAQHLAAADALEREQARQAAALAAAVAALEQCCSPSEAEDSIVCEDSGMEVAAAGAEGQEAGGAEAEREGVAVALVEGQLAPAPELMPVGG